MYLQLLKVAYTEKQNWYWNKSKTVDKIWSDWICMFLSIFPVQIYNFSVFYSFLVLFSYIVSSYFHLKAYLTGICLFTWRPIRDQGLWKKSWLNYVISFLKYYMCIYIYWNSSVADNKNLFIYLFIYSLQSPL